MVLEAAAVVVFVICFQQQQQQRVGVFLLLNYRYAALFLAPYGAKTAETDFLSFLFFHC
jgi:hypothetical protein